MADALIAAGADIEARGASIAGGTPLDGAVGYGCWQVARLLVDRGARVDKLWHAAALVMMSRVEEFGAKSPGPTPKRSMMVSGKPAMVHSDEQQSTFSAAARI